MVQKNVKNFKIGDRVIGTGGNPPKNEGPGFIWRERFNFRTMGYSSNKKRGYSNYVITDDWEPIHIPDQVTYLQAALCEPCGVTIRAMRLSNFKLGDTVAIFGGGPIGMLMLQVAKAAGASKIIATEISQTRIDTLYKLGADKVVNPLKENVITEIEDFTIQYAATIVKNAPLSVLAAKTIASQGRRLPRRISIRVDWLHRIDDGHIPQKHNRSRWICRNLEI